MAAQAATQASERAAPSVNTTTTPVRTFPLACAVRQKSVCLGGRLRGHDESAIPRWYHGQRIRQLLSCAVLATLATGLATTTAHAQSDGATCANAYYAALQDVRASRGDELSGAFSALRSADPVLSGRWIYSRALFEKPSRYSRPLEAERECAEKIKVAGRQRCVRFVEPAIPAEPPLPAELEIAQQPSNDELRVLKAVADLVQGRGAIPDVGNNGRYTWVAQRATTDLKTYINQPAHNALCSGAREVTEFYAKALKPLQKRIDDVGELVRKARALAGARIFAIGAVNPAVDGMPEPIAADTPEQPLITLVADAVRLVVPGETVATILKETSPLAALQRAKPSLILAQVQAKKSEDQATRDRVTAVALAVRMLEAAAYTEIYAARYRKFSASVISLPTDIQAVHARTCTCGF